MFQNFPPRFLKVSREASYWSVFAKVGTCIIGIVGALFCIMLGSWPAGYIYMLYCFVMMQVFCVMGTLVQKTVSMTFKHKTGLR